MADYIDYFQPYIRQLAQGSDGKYNTSGAKSTVYLARYYDVEEHGKVGFLDSSVGGSTTILDEVEIKTPHKFLKNSGFVPVKTDRTTVKYESKKLANGTYERSLEFFVAQDDAELSAFVARGGNMEFYALFVTNDRPSRVKILGEHLAGAEMEVVDFTQGTVKDGKRGFKVVIKDYNHAPNTYYPNQVKIKNEDTPITIG